MVKNTRWMTCFFLLLLTVTCKDSSDSVIPYAPVNFTVNLNIHNELLIDGNSKYFPLDPNIARGVAGVIIYRQFGNYYAFDAACTYEVIPSCHVSPTGNTGICGCCGSEYIFDEVAWATGSSKAKEPLKRYQVQPSGTIMLQVYN